MSEVREEWARVLEIIATEGFPQPRDLDVALDALEGANGIPVATLAGLRDGSLVAVPREPTRKQWDRVAEMCYAVPESTWQLRAEAIWPEVVQAFAMLAAAQEPGHD